jgi:hypothetical protein
MKTKDKIKWTGKQLLILWVVIFISIGLGRGCGRFLNSRPIIVDCTETEGRKYYITYEVMEGEYREQVKDQVSCRR